jgi:polyferredoxin
MRCCWRTSPSWCSTSADWLLIVAGNRLDWRWVNRRWFRAAHLAAIAVVVAQAWLGITCPLTTLESWLRALAGSAPYNAGFIEHWVQRILFYEAPAWVFVTAYTLFGLLVAGGLVAIPAGTQKAGAVRPAAGYFSGFSWSFWPRFPASDGHKPL